MARLGAKRTMDDILLEAEEALTAQPTEQEPTEPRNIQLSELTELADQLVQVSNDIEDAEAKLSELKALKKTVSEETLPTLMESAGIATLELADGVKIKVNDFVDARIKDPSVAFDWLRQTNNDSIIKNQITIALDRGNDNLAEEITEKIKREYGIDADRKIAIHHATLKSFCRDALESEELAESLPRDAFGIYEGKRAKITK